MEKFFLILVVLLIWFSSCSKKKIPADDSAFGFDYYPVTAGKFVVYDVDSTVYTNLPVDTVFYRYRIKEKIADSFTDNLGQPAFRLERYIKLFKPNVSYDSIPWAMKEVWLVNASQKNIQVVEGNIRYTKLIFPVEAHASWDGNAHNTIGAWLYNFDYINQRESFGKQAFEQVLRVVQKDFKTLISYQLYSEKYAKGIGLVEREITDVLSNTIVAGLAIEKRIETGLIYKQTILNYGYE